MQAYARVARFYDAVMGDRTDTAAFVQHLIVQHKPNAKSLLELACGTGEVLRHLAASYTVAGLDASPQMLAIARRKLPGVPLHRQNMVVFQLRRQFDVIICIYDSINHVLGFSDWRKIFRRASEHLAPQGLFVFDINTAAKLQRRLRTPPQVNEFNGSAVIMTVTNAGRGVTNWNIRLLERKDGGGWRVLEENIKEVSFSVPRIKTALQKYFRRIRVVDPMNGRPSLRSDRLYFVCQK